MLEIPVMGVNAPIEHQRVIRKLTGELHILYKDGRIQQEPFSETMINSSQTSPTPDVLLLDNQVNQYVVVIEVSAKQGVKKDLRKLIELMSDYDVPEGFVFDYESKVWYKYELAMGKIKEKNSFCDTIGYDLNDFLV